MNSLYRFSPINTKEEFLEVIKYVAGKAIELCKKVTWKEYPIASLTIFSHYEDESLNLKEILLEMGELSSENNGQFVKLRVPILLQNGKLEYLRVRKPDPYRMQVGCNDFELPSYYEFKEKYLNKSENLRLIERKDYEMIEFFDPDFDVLAYVVSKNLND